MVKIQREAGLARMLPSRSTYGPVVQSKRHKFLAVPKGGFFFFLRWHEQTHLFRRGSSNFSFSEITVD